jgi:hypothetical protein
MTQLEYLNGEFNLIRTRYFDKINYYIGAYESKHCISLVPKHEYMQVIEILGSIYNSIFASGD